MFLWENTVQIQTRTISNISLILVSLTIEFLLYNSFYPSHPLPKIPPPRVETATSEGLSVPPLWTEKGRGRQQARKGWWCSSLHPGGIEWKKESLEGGSTGLPGSMWGLLGRRETKGKGRGWGESLRRPKVESRMKQREEGVSEEWGGGEGNSKELGNGSRWGVKD